MAMEKVEHFSHGCALTLPEIAVRSICSICYKDEPVEYTCKPCNFDICEDCSKLPQKVSHDFHQDHLLEFCLHQYDQKPGYIVCSGCGNMSCGSFYKCKDCEIYLDLGCALMENIFRGWDAKEMLHYSHRHLLKRCRPGQDAQGSCLLCEFPVSPSSICYGCVYCYSFLHEHCLQLPTEFQHPVHPAHPLKRLDYLQNLGKAKYCDACGEDIVGVPFGCKECDFDIHLRCADSLLRGLMHKSHEHKLYYVSIDAQYYSWKKKPCQICMGTRVMSVDSCYRCLECKLYFHFECLEIPDSVVKKSCHIHPLVCKRFLAENDSLEYCDICETLVHGTHHAYSCEICDFLAHIECILREEAPSPLYLKELYSCDEYITIPTVGDDCQTDELENPLLVNGIEHIHVMGAVQMSELENVQRCDICNKRIHGSPWKCESCDFATHDYCAEMGKLSKDRLHLNHPLTLLPKPPTQVTMHCEICRKDVKGFNLFCRLCDFIIDISCILKDRLSHRVLGQRVIGTVKGRCMSDKHSMVQVIVSNSYQTACAICDERFHGKALSCMMCEEIYHPRCIELKLQPLLRHPLHPDHLLSISLTSGSKCIACKMDMRKYGYRCPDICEISFHIECFKAANASGKTRSHIHTLYSFWIEGSRVCCVCGRPCGASFYGCIDCNFTAHVECIGFPANVKNQRHQHTLMQSFSASVYYCDLCGSHCCGVAYRCNLCSGLFHLKCVIPSDREAGTEEDQLQDIFLMYLERYSVLPIWHNVESKEEFSFLLFPQM